MDIRELVSKRNFAFHKINEINKQVAKLQRELDFFVATTIAVDKEIEDLKRQFNVERAQGHACGMRGKPDIAVIGHGGL